MPPKLKSSVKIKAIDTKGTTQQEQACLLMCFRTVFCFLAKKKKKGINKQFKHIKHSQNNHNNFHLFFVFFFFVF
jgi:hypothetical protein